MRPPDSEGRPAGNGPAPKTLSSSTDVTPVYTAPADPTWLLDAALDLAAAGWRVFPCRPSGPAAKAPLLPAPGHHLASTDTDRIIQWWTQWPTAMIGAPVPLGLLALDIDPRNGGTLDALEDVLGPLPETSMVLSGRGDGGMHLYYLRPPGVLVSTRLPAGVDLKLSGYCIVPPSIHPASGMPYTWGARRLRTCRPGRSKSCARPSDQR
ncbi:MAG: bifunctional DNA primase/polymerase [Pseudonocardiales bacterium]